jgi:hypothetical protein
MKKILLSVFAICLSVGAIAQATTCNFGTATLHTVPGVYPTSLPDGTLNTPYNQLMEVVLPQDTTIAGIGQIDVCFIQVDSVRYIADGLSYTCGEHTPGLVDPTGPANGCKWKVIHTPGVVNRGCVIISGTPTTGTKIFNDSLQVWVKAGGGAYVPQTGQCLALQNLNTPYNVYHHIIGTNAITGAVAKDLNLSLFPNPTNANSTLSFTLPERANVNVAVYDLMGKRVVDVFAGTETAGNHTYNVAAEKLTSGIYLLKVSLDNGASVITNRLIVE